jgi:hypothetical protein
MTTIIRLTLKNAIDELIGTIVGKGSRDKFFPRDAELGLKADLYDAWQRQFNQLKMHLWNYGMNQSLSKLRIPDVLDLMRQYFAGTAITNQIRTSTQYLKAAYGKGQEHTDVQYKKQVGKGAIEKAFKLRGLLGYGLDEEYALQALEQQLVLSAGGFWDEQMSESIRNEMQSWFDGDFTREELAEKLKKLVNDRLSIEGSSSKPRSYFDGLSEHLVVRSRSIGALNRAHSLGATKYKIQNPLDSRTSSVCRELTKSGKVFTVAGAKGVVDNMLNADSLDELKTAQPFISSPAAAHDPVPPLHWRCRSWQEFVFEGLS